MEDQKKRGRYRRIYDQLKELLMKTDEPISRMASVCAVLHYKMDYFFWTGFYLFKNDKLIVGPYQGPLACQELEKNKGVCWAAVNRAEPVVVKDVHKFPGHIACDSRSQSDITLPVFNDRGDIVAVFDVDSDLIGSFNDADRTHLQQIMKLIYGY